MAAGMILSVSWGTDEAGVQTKASPGSHPEAEQNGHPPDAVEDQAVNGNTDAPAKRQKRTRTEFELNG
jgi:hypothetical protein